MWATIASIMSNQEVILRERVQRRLQLGRTPHDVPTVLGMVPWGALFGAKEYVMALSESPQP